MTWLSEIASWLESKQLSCFYRSGFGMDCAGCGAQRSVVALLRGEWLESFNAYPPLGLLILLFLATGLHLLFRFPNSGVLLRYIFVAAISSVLLNFVYKLLHV